MSSCGKELFEEHEWLRGKTPPELCRALPLTTHEDAGPFSKNQSVVAHSFGCVLGTGSELETKRLFGCYLKTKQERLAPNDAGMGDFIESMRALMVGVGPATDRRGQQF